MKTPIIYICVLLLTVSGLSSQEAGLGNWVMYIGNKKIAQKWNWEQSVQYRNYNLIGDIHQLLVRSGIGYNLGENNHNLSLGYDYLYDTQYDVDDVKSIVTSEHRIYQQFLTKQRLGRVHWRHRYRVEERFINADFLLRFRYAMFVRIPINQPDLVQNALYFSTYNEVFLNTEGTIFNQNWLYGGLGYILNSKIKIELGYMNQSLNLGSRDQLNMIAFINW